MKRIIPLLSPDPQASGDPTPPPEPATPNAGEAAIPAGSGEPGPAASAVIAGGKTERELVLEAELEGERQSHARTTDEKKEREIKIAELEDQLHALRNPPEPEKPKSNKVRAFGLRFED